MLPAHSVGGHGIFRRRRPVVARQEGAHHVVRVRRLGQIVDRPGLHRGHRAGDIAVTGEHNHLGVRPGGVDGLYHRQPVAVLKPHVDYREGGRGDLDRAYGLADAAGQGYLKAAALQSAPQPRSQWGVIVQQEQGFVGQVRYRGGEFDHSTVRSATLRL